jgi:hypothetical protein
VGLILFIRLIEYFVDGFKIWDLVYAIHCGNRALSSTSSLCDVYGTSFVDYVIVFSWFVSSSKFEGHLYCKLKSGPLCTTTA